MTLKVTETVFSIKMKRAKPHYHNFYSTSMLNSKIYSPTSSKGVFVSNVLFVLNIIYNVKLQKYFISMKQL